MDESRRQDVIAGVLLGTALGDAIGLPREGLAPGRARRLLGPDPRPQLLPGRAMLSDDTEHACMLAQALLASRGGRERFTRSLAWRLRFWMAALPPGVGLGTARAIGKLWLGFPPSRSGVRSAGNGPAMRSALLGVATDGNADDLASWVAAATRLTHRDPRAERAALLVALAAREGARHGPGGVDGSAFLAGPAASVADDDPELRHILDVLAEHLQSDAPLADLAAALGLAGGVTGYAYHTVPVALYAWMTCPGDFRRAVSDVILLGGDADTTGAIAGAILGATVGAGALPQDWLDGVTDFPRSIGWIRRLADRVAAWTTDPAAARPLPFAWPLVLPRNLFLLLIVLAHGFRRLLPPYDRGQTV